MFFKLTDIVLRRVVAHNFRDCCHTHRRVRQKILTSLDAYRADNLRVGHAGQLFDQTGSVFIGIMELFR